MPSGPIGRARRMGHDARLDEKRDGDECSQGDNLQGQSVTVARLAPPEPERDAGQNAECDGDDKVSRKKCGGNFSRPLAGKESEQIACDAEGEEPEHRGPGAA